MRFGALLVAVALVGFGAVAVGCGDDGDDVLTLEQYFERIGELDDEREARFDATNQELDDLGEDVSADELADSVEKQLRHLKDFRDDLAAIAPPAEVRDAHDQSVTLLEAALDQFDAVIRKLREADSIDEALATLDDAAFSELGATVEACLELAQIASDNDIDADLDCET